MRGRRLRFANLDESRLYGTDLIRVDLSRATLRATDLTGANLIGADLRGAGLTGTPVDQGQLDKAWSSASGISGGVSQM